MPHRYSHYIIIEPFLDICRKARARITAASAVQRLMMHVRTMLTLYLYVDRNVYITYENLNVH